MTKRLIAMAFAAGTMFGAWGDGASVPVTAWKFYEEADDKIGLNLAAWEDFGKLDVAFWIGDGVYSVTLVTKKGETLTLALDSAAEWNANQLTGTFAAVAGRPPYQVVARKNAFGKTWFFNAEGNERDGWRLSYAENAKAAALTVTLNADGSTKIAGKLVDAQERVPPVSVSSSGYADVTSLSEGVIIADFAPVVSVKDGKATVKRVLSIGTNLWFDRSNDHPYIGSIYLQ